MGETKRVKKCVSIIPQLLRSNALPKTEQQQWAYAVLLPGKHFRNQHSLHILKQTAAL